MNRVCGGIHTLVVKTAFVETLHPTSLHYPNLISYSYDDEKLNLTQLTRISLPLSELIATSDLRRLLLISSLGLVALSMAHEMALIYRIQPAVSLWFPPSGVAITLAFWFGPVGIVLTGIASFLMSPMWGLQGWERLISLTDIVEPLVAWWIYRRLWRGSLILNNLKDAFLFTLSGPVIACTTLALVGSLAFAMVGKIPASSLAESIPHWWLGNAIGTMAIVPSALFVVTPLLQHWGWVSNREKLNISIPVNHRFSRRFWLEVSAILLLCTATAGLTVAGTKYANFTFQQFSFLSFIPILWAATRFGVTSGMLTSSFCVLVTLFAYLVAYPNAILLPNFPVQPEVLHVHKLSLLVQCVVSLLVGTVITEREKSQVALAVEKIRLGEYQARAELSEQLLRLNHSLADANTRLEESHQEKDALLQREQAARESAENANRIKDEFLAVLSHELRTPLNPILGWANLLRKRKFDEATFERGLETIERNAKLQTRLIEDLLDISRILQGKMLLTTDPVLLVDTIEAALETVRLAAEAKNIQIQTRLDPHTGQILGDSARLQQIVWNLVSNAVKFTPDGGRVEVRLERLITSSKEYAQIQVIDTGKGISPDFLPHVFEYFRQADSKITRQFGGLGLGLAIVRRLTELHGGSVQVESPGIGLGSTFTVKLPLMPAVLHTPISS